MMDKIMTTLIALLS